MILARRSKLTFGALCWVSPYPTYTYANNIFNVLKISNPSWGIGGLFYHNLYTHYIPENYAYGHFIINNKSLLAFKDVGAFGND